MGLIFNSSFVYLGIFWWEYNIIMYFPSVDVENHLLYSKSPHLHLETHSFMFVLMYKHAHAHIHSTLVCPHTSLSSYTPYVMPVVEDYASLLLYSYMGLPEGKDGNFD